MEIGNLPYIVAEVNSSHAGNIEMAKRMIDAAAKALGVETQWVDQAHISEQVTASAETLALADCDGIIICTSTSVNRKFFPGKFSRPNA